MALLTTINDKMGKNNWPPRKDVKANWEQVEYWDALRSGNIQYLKPEALRRGLGGDPAEPYNPMPVPFALAKASSNLLFGEDPIVTAGDPDDQERLETIIEENNLWSGCRAAAITAASCGAVYIKVALDPTTPTGQEVPLVQFISPLRVIPKFAPNGELLEATVITEWDDDKKNVYRLLEWITPDFTQYSLYKGTNTSLGAKQELSQNENTKGLKEEISNPLGKLPIYYWVNARATDSPYGISDYDNGLDTLFYQFNDATATGHQAMQASVPRTAVPQQFLDENNNLRHDKTIISVNELADTLGEGDLNNLFATIQHDAQTDKFINYANEVLDWIAIFIGINPQQLGRPTDGAAASGIALRIKLSSTLANAASKSALAEPILAKALQMLAQLDELESTVEVNGKKYTKQAQKWVDATAKISVELKDGLPDDEAEIAGIIQTLRSSGVMSVKQGLVRSNPNLNDEQIDELLAEIESDKTTEIGAIGNALPTPSAVDLVGDINAELDSLIANAAGAPAEPVTE